MFDDQNTSPLENGSYTEPSTGAGSAPETSGEYHYTRETNPGGQEPYTAQQPAANAYQSGYQGGQAGGQPNRQSYQSAQPGYGSGQQGYQGGQSGYQSGYRPSYQGTGGGNVPPEQPGSGKRGRKKNPKPPKPPKQKKGVGLGAIVAVALVCSILGGAVGVGGAYALQNYTSGDSTTNNITVTDRSGSGGSVDTTTVKAGDEMTPAQIYSKYGSAVVSVNVTTSEGEGAGTGFITDGKNGYLLTCYHVIDGASAISVTLTDSTSYSASYIGGDADQDVAILQINANEGETLDLNSVVLGDSSQLAVGDTVCAIGNALGTLANTLTSGSVSALDRAISMSDGTVMNLMQTDTTINSGNSGGPLFNQYGEVIGIVNAKYSSSAYDTSTASIEGIGFAIPINDVTSIMDDLMEHGYITGKPYLGISVATVSAVTAQQYSDMVVGAYVSSVTEGSCAETAGLQQGDIITQADGTDITTSAELIDAKNTHKAGDEMTLTVYRDSEYITIKVTLDEEQPESSPISDGSSDSNSSDSQQGSSDYDYGYSYGSNGNSSGNSGSSGSSWPFSFYGY